MISSITPKVPDYFSKELQRYLARRLENSADVPDLTQEIFLRFAGVRQQELIRNPKAYLFSIAHNVVYNWYQQSLREVVTFNSCIADAAMNNSTQHATEPAELLDAAQRLQTMLSCVPTLYAAIVVMKKRDGMSYKEIACALNITVHTVKKYLARAIAQLRKTYPQGRP